MVADTFPVLLDNCAISACFKAGRWDALASRYRLETVEEVASEAATGSQNRPVIDPAAFRKQVVVHAVSREDILACQIEHADLASLDDGERDLWVHALGRKDAWILCGPDIASIKFGVARGYGDRLISLEALLEQMGVKARTPLQEHQTKAWLRGIVGKFTVEIALAKVS